METPRPKPSKQEFDDEAVWLGVGEQFAEQRRVRGDVDAAALGEPVQRVGAARLEHDRAAELLQQGERIVVGAGEPAARDGDANLGGELAGAVLVEQHGDGFVVGNREAGQGAEFLTETLHRQQVALVAGDDDVVALLGQEGAHGPGPGLAALHPGRHVLDRLDVGRGQSGGAEVERGGMHLDALATERADGGEEAAGVVAHDQRLAAARNTAGRDHAEGLGRHQVVVTQHLPQRGRVGEGAHSRLAERIISANLLTVAVAQRGCDVK